MKIREFTQAPDKRKGSKPWSKKRTKKYLVKSTYKFIDTNPKVGKRLLKEVRNTQRYFLLLSDQTVLIGFEFDVMRAWKTYYKNRRIEEMDKTDSTIGGIMTPKYNVVITNLSKFIEQN